MKRFTILRRLMTTGRTLPIDYADTPAAAVQLARKYAEQNIDVRIGDNQAEDHFDPQTFAAKHGLR